MKKLLPLLVVMIVVVGFTAYRNINNAQKSYEKVIRDYFQYLSEKNFDEANKLVTDNLKIDNEEKKNYMQDTLISINLLEVSENKDESKMVKQDDMVSLKVKYESIYSDKFIPVGNEKPGKNVVIKNMTLIKSDGTWKISEWGY